MAPVVSLDEFAGELRETITLFRDTQVNRAGLPSLVINRHLADARILLEGELSDAIGLARTYPELLLAALEQIEGSKLFSEEYIDQSAFIGLYSRPIPADVFLFAWDRFTALEKLAERGASVCFAKSRDSLVYFAQNMVRHAYHFGGISRSPKAFARYVNYHSPGLVLLTSEPSGHELMILSALRQFHIPMWQVGERWLTEEDFTLIAEDDLTRALDNEFRRRRWHLARPDEKGAWPRSEPVFKPCGGNYNSFFVVRSMGGVDGVEVRGEIINDIAIIIDIGDSDIDITMTAFLEKQLIELINRSGSIKAAQDEWFTLYIDPARTSPHDVGKILYDIIKKEFDLKQVSVNVVSDPFRLASLRPGLLAYRDNREKEIARQDELNSSFYMCTRCRSYAKEHFCIVTSERPPQCGRSYEMIKTLAHAADSEEYMPIKKGELLDRRRGEFSGVNKIAKLMTNGRIERVYLHSMLEHPHPSSAEFNILAFHIPRLDGIGLIHRGFGGATPDGRTWEELENLAVGRQSSGVIATSLAYIGCRMFLAANGGPANILWMTSHVKDLLGWYDRRIATEKDCTNLTALKNFYD